MQCSILIFGFLFYILTWKKKDFLTWIFFSKKLSTNFRKSSGFLIFHTIVCRFPSVGNTPHWIAWEWRGVRKPPLWLTFCPVTDLMLILKICSNYFFLFALLYEPIKVGFLRVYFQFRDEFKWMNEISVFSTLLFT